MKTRKRRKVQTNKAKASYISQAAFVDLKKGMEDALAFERGKRLNLKVTRIQVPHPAKDNVV